MAEYESRARFLGGGKGYRYKVVRVSDDGRERLIAEYDHFVPAGEVVRVLNSMAGREVKQ